VNWQGRRAAPSAAFLPLALVDGDVRYDAPFIEGSCCPLVPARLRSAFRPFDRSHRRDRLLGSIFLEDNRKAESGDAEQYED
jgi:hypothetical protein